MADLQIKIHPNTDPMTPGEKPAESKNTPKSCEEILAMLEKDVKAKYDEQTASDIQEHIDAISEILSEAEKAPQDNQDISGMTDSKKKTDYMDQLMNS